MFYRKSKIVLGFVGLCAIQIPTMEAMQTNALETGYTENVAKGDADFASIEKYGCTRETVIQLLNDEKLHWLQKALRKRFDRCKIENCKDSKQAREETLIFVDWISSYNNLFREPKNKPVNAENMRILPYNPLMLYYELNGWQNLAKIAEGLNKKEATRAYICYIFLTIIIYADLCAAKCLGFKDQQVWAFKFLMSKMENMWLPLINNEELGGNFDADVINRIKNVVTVAKKHNTISSTKLDFLNQLHSPAWITCCSAKTWNIIGLYPNTIYFGQPTEAIKELFNTNSETVKKARAEAIKKAINIFKNLKTQTIAAKIKESASKLSTL